MKVSLRIGFQYFLVGDKNNIGQIAKTQDQSGETRITEYDFKGNPLTSEKQYCVDYQNDIDWSQSPTLQDETFNQAIEYDALNRPTLLTQPDTSKIKYTYNKGAMLETVEVQHRGQGNYQSYVSNVNYNEKGQRTDIYYGNSSKTKYEYDNKTFRVTRILTTRNTGIDILQNIYYFYDPIGNITEMRDDAQQVHYFNNTVVAPTGKYEYDPLYRLLKAEGRELALLNAPDYGDFANNIPVPSGSDMQNYVHQYSFDQLGNIQTLQSTGGNGWTRTYNYNNTANNYLSSTQVGQDVFSYTYDVHGNMTSMPHLSSMQWDFADRLRQVQLNLSGDMAYYIYDMTGNRSRKVIVKGNIVEERCYFGGYEIYRKTISGILDTERQTLQIEDNQQKVALIETQTISDGNLQTPPNITIRYQYDNHLGSACLELDETADIISYEEYHPFGTTSYRSGRTETEVSLKRYKYVGKERDEETGLYYYGARYYAAWLCKFVSVDALQHKYPHYTPYQYAGNKPITYIDIDGLEEYIFVKFIEKNQLKSILIYRISKENQKEYNQKYFDDIRKQINKNINISNKKQKKELEKALEDTDKYQKEDNEKSQKDKVLYVTVSLPQYDESKNKLKLAEIRDKVLEEIDTDVAAYIFEHISHGSQISKITDKDKNTIEKGAPNAYPMLTNEQQNYYNRWVTGLVPDFSFNTISSVSPTFELNSSELTLKGKDELQSLLCMLTLFPDMKVSLVGHTDITGNDTDNNNLSLNRAQSVKDYLVSKGVNADNIQVSGVGSSQLLPNVPANDPSNRRVTINQINN